jgi:hypothetical protein
MQHWIHHIVRVFKQAADALFFGGDATLRETLQHRLGSWTGMDDDHGFGGVSDDTADRWSGLEGGSAPTGPAFNVDGTPMMSGGMVDISGKPFGVTDTGTGLGGSFGHDVFSSLSSTDWSSSSGSDWSSSSDWSSGSSWSSHDW